MARGGGADTQTARWRGARNRGRITLRRSGVDYFRGAGSDWIALAGLLLLVPAITCATLLDPVWFSPALLALPVIVGGLLLRPASLLGLYAAAATALIVESVRLRPDLREPAAVTPGTVLTVAACGVVGLGLAQLRARVGVPWRRGGTMLFDRRARIRVPSALPRLPQGWHRAMALRPSGGQSFPGHFVVAARTNRGRTLEVVLTDVSGNGMAAASRALLLSGAFGGLLGSLPPHGFLPAANGYLLRQDWD
ncbi:serine/threonine-protein phosphatase, partial [Burkholderia sp. Ax-1735]